MTSGADGNVLAASDGVLRAAPGDDDAARGVNSLWDVVDRGLGRIALKNADGRYVSVAGAGDAGQVTLKEGEPGDAETFQWIDLQRGDLMLMSLATDRYLCAEPNQSGPVAANRSGPRPDRKAGGCFRWEIVDR